MARMQVIGIGAGGHAKVVLEVLRSCQDVDVVGLLDPRSELWNTTILGVPVLGDDSLLPALHDRGIRGAFIGVGGVRDTGPRRRTYEAALAAGFEVIAAVHPRATVSQSARIGRGPTIMAGAVINAEARLDDNVLVNTGAIVEHECVIGRHVHLATGSRLAGNVRVEDGGARRHRRHRPPGTDDRPLRVRGRRRGRGAGRARGSRCGGDYNEGYVMPVAIGLSCWVGIGPRDDRKLAIYSENLNESVELSLANPDLHPSRNWSDYPVGVAKILQQTVIPCVAPTFIFGAKFRWAPG